MDPTGNREPDDRRIAVYMPRMELPVRPGGVEERGPPGNPRDISVYPGGALFFRFQKAYAGVRSLRIDYKTPARVPISRSREPVPVSGHVGVPAVRHPDEGRPDEHGELPGSAGPLLDYPLVEYMASLPISFKLRDGISKYLFRRICKRLLPPTVLEKKKQGFAIPKGDWFQKELRSVRRRDTVGPGRPCLEGTSMRETSGGCCGTMPRAGVITATGSGVSSSWRCGSVVVSGQRVERRLPFPAMRILYHHRTRGGDAQGIHIREIIRRCEDGHMKCMSPRSSRNILAMSEPENRSDEYKAGTRGMRSAMKS